jgi:diacylglycerol kinase (ATP)
MADSTVSSHAPRSPFQIWRAMVWSMKGLKAAWDYESSFRLEVYLFLVLVPAALWFGQDGLERAVLIASLMGVLIVEIVNSAIEAVVDRFGGEHHELSGRAKDLGSASVFLADLVVLLCWGLILGPRLLAWMGG